MRFIRSHGRIIPIRDSRPGAALEATGSATVGVAAVHGLSKAAAQSSHEASRIGKLSNRASKNASKAAERLKSGIITRNASPQFQKKMVARIKHQSARVGKLGVAGNRAFLAKTALSRGAFILGGVALGHAATKGIQAMSGKDVSDKASLGANVAGFSVAAIASKTIHNALKAKNISRISKILKMVKI